MVHTQKNNQYAPEHTSFREISRELNIPKVVLDKDVLRKAATAESSNEIPIDTLVLSVAGNEASHDSSPESGVYTEGGLVFVPDVDAKHHQGARCKSYS